ncbi:MAG TPA: tyrosine-type recombinase/integrase [Pseudonocardiaceae bacterium]|nr:tyrosine-type recombinase/integrase [Pseudonocardiaceae bacterium]
MGPAPAHHLLSVHAGDVLPCYAYVFLGPKGGPPARSNFHTIWNKARQQAGVPELHLHDLRHTRNTLAAETRATLRELMERMGHRLTRAALIYLHARDHRDRAIADGFTTKTCGAGDRDRTGMASLEDRGWIMVLTSKNADLRIPGDRGQD